MTPLENAIETLKQWLPIDKNKLPTEAHEAYDVLDELTEGFKDFSDVSAFPEFETLLIEFADKVDEILSKQAFSTSKKETPKKTAKPKKQTTKKASTTKTKLDEVKRLANALKMQIEFLKVD